MCLLLLSHKKIERNINIKRKDKQVILVKDDGEIDLAAIEDDSIIENNTFNNKYNFVNKSETMEVIIKEKLNMILRPIHQNKNQEEKHNEYHCNQFISSCSRKK